VEQGSQQAMVEAYCRAFERVIAGAGLMDEASAPPVPGGR
jgi:hypothetical protein